MAELYLVRHGQASFGQDNYDALSETGWEQSRLLGEAFTRQGLTFDRVVIGSMVRHRETLEGIKQSCEIECETEVHAGFNEYDFHTLLKSHYGGQAPHEVMQDRRTHFQTLREVLRLWQQDEIDGAPETWSDFKARIKDAMTTACRPDAKRVLVVSSGGATGQVVSSALNAPEEMMIKVNLQVKNTSYSRFVFNQKAFYLNGFNATPHLDEASKAHLLTYS